jgi:Mor family transcriptional regulator
MNDMVVANRQAAGERLSEALLGRAHINGRGEKNGRSVLSDSQVQEIRDSVSSIGDLAKQYGVSKTTIRRVLLRKIWKHI